jgi:hypothetical protein
MGFYSRAPIFRIRTHNPKVPSNRTPHDRTKIGNTCMKVIPIVLYQDPRLHLVLLLVAVDTGLSIQDSPAIYVSIGSGKTEVNY